MVRRDKLKTVLIVFSLFFLCGATSENLSAREKFKEMPQIKYSADFQFIPAMQPVSDGRKALSFTLEDQFGKNFAIKFPADKVTVLVFGDRSGSGQIEGWVRPLYNKFTDKIYIFGIAELSAVPWAARPLVRGFIKSRSKNSIMLDWSGKISKSYGYRKNKANLFVVSKSGHIVAEKSGAATNAALTDLYREINAIL